MSRILENLECPRCNSTEFLAGPRGGAARNIKCAECGYWMNVSVVPRLIPGTETIVAGKYWITDEAEIKKLEAESE